MQSKKNTLSELKHDSILLLLNLRKTPYLIIFFSFLSAVPDRDVLLFPLLVSACSCCRPIWEQVGDLYQDWEASEKGSSKHHSQISAYLALGSARLTPVTPSHAHWVASRSYQLGIRGALLLTSFRSGDLQGVRKAQWGSKELRQRSLPHLHANAQTPGGAVTAQRTRRADRGQRHQESSPRSAHLVSPDWWVSQSAIHPRDKRAPERRLKDLPKGTW